MFSHTLVLNYIFGGSDGCLAPPTFHWRVFIQCGSFMFLRFILVFSRVNVILKVWRTKSWRTDGERGQTERPRDTRCPQLTSFRLSSPSLLRWNLLSSFFRNVLLFLAFAAQQSAFFVLSAFVKSALINSSGWYEQKLDLNVWPRIEQHSGPLMPCDGFNAKKGHE